MTDEEAHSDLGASGSFGWLNCFGRRREIRKLRHVGVASAPSEYAREGTLAHNFAAQWLQLGEAPDGVSPEMRGHLSSYASAVNSAVMKGQAAGWGTAEIMIEKRVGAPKVHRDLWGTLDAALWWQKMGFLWVCDLKYGSGRFVSVQGNTQIRLYAAYLVLMLSDLGHVVREVTVSICQPRIECEEGTMRSEPVPVLELIELLNTARTAALRSEEPDAPLNPGPWCAATYCPAQATCPALRELATRSAQTSFAHLIQPDGGYDPVALAEAFEQIPLLKARIEAVSNFAYSEAHAGRPPPGLKLVETKKGARKWSKSVAEVAQVLGLNQPKFFTAPELRSPPQVDDIWKEMGVKKADRDKLLEPLITQGEPNKVLVSVNDPRPAIARAPEQVFAGLIEQPLARVSERERLAESANDGPRGPEGDNPL